MRNKKKSHRISVDNVEYRWAARGDDGYISVGIWPSNNIGPYIHGNFAYHETWIPIGENHSQSAGDQIIITNRIVQRIIEFAVSRHNYNPLEKGKELNLRRLDNEIRWDDAIRASND